MLTAANIPIIDLSGPPADVAAQLVDAAEEHGFIYIKNRGLDISPDEIDGAFKLSSKIFDLPLEEKKKCSIQTNNRGWSGMHSETLDPTNQRVGDFKEAFNFGEFKDGKAQQPLPPSITPDEPQVNTFSTSCHNLCDKLLRLLGQGLDVGDFFSSAHDPSKGTTGSIVRLLRYPAPDTTPHAASDVRAGAHSDYGSVTLLFRLRGQAGLEIQKRDDGSWAPVPVTPPGTESDPAPPILVNIGDLLSYWTNGLFRSTVHRVVFPGPGGKGGDSLSGDAGVVAGETNAGPRYSIAYFCHPIGEARLEPVPSERVQNFVPPDGHKDHNPYADRKTLTADEHLFMRLKASYGDLYADKKESQ